MKNVILSFSFGLILLVGLNVPAFAQRNVSPAFDPVLEADARHNLDVAYQAFSPAKKAYKQIILRFEETFAAYPEFSRMDEFLYLAGMSSYYLSENMGKQKVNLRSAKEKEKYAPAKLKEDAIAYLSNLIEKYPQTPRRVEAEKILVLLKVEK